MSRIAIIGGGIGGLTTAIALRHFGFSPEIYEQAPALLDVGAAIAIWPNALRVLQKLDLAEKVLEKAGRIVDIQWRDLAGRVINQVSLHDFSERQSIPAVALHRADLQLILVNALPVNSIHLGSSLLEQTQINDSVIAHLANGSVFEADLLVAADGIHSMVRAKLLNDAPPIYRGYAVWRGISPNAPASIPTATAIEFLGGGKRFGLGPIGHGRVGWWATANAANTSLKVEERSADRTTWKQGESVGPLKDRNAKGELLRLFDGWHRPILQLIEATPSASILKTGAFDRNANKRWGNNRVTLLGDAIHPTTPNLGQGGCMAIEDAMILARCFQQYGLELTALRRYEQLRYKRTSALTRYSRQYGAIGQWENIWLRGARRSFLSLIPESIVRRLMQVVFEYDACEVAT
jgi:2-polyprenyl-6-methoxyphenol hydroxylase-like FAD-dependent oxidoreductase